MGALVHISLQLSNNTVPAFTPPTFEVSNNAAVVNVLFFLSLSLVLIDALLAMLLKSWLREFNRAWRRHNATKPRAQERELRIQSLERWKLPQLVIILPILLLLSLFLFCIGLLVLIFPLHRITAAFTLGTLLMGLSLYITTMVISAFDVHSPFSSPQSCSFIHLTTPAYRVISRAGKYVTTHVLRIIHPLLSPWALPSVIDQQANTSLDQDHKHDDPACHRDIANRLFDTIPEVADNVPLFLELLATPMKYSYLRPRSREVWGQLVRATVDLLGDPEHYTIPVAMLIARALLPCADSRILRVPLSKALQCSSPDSDPLLFQTVYRQLLDMKEDTFPPYPQWSQVCEDIRDLRPSDSTASELIWLIDVISLYGNSSRQIHPQLNYEQLGEFLSSVLIYSSKMTPGSEDRRRLVMAVIWAIRGSGYLGAYGHSTTSNEPVPFLDGYLLVKGLGIRPSKAGLFVQVNTVDTSQFEEEIPNLMAELLTIQPTIPDSFYSPQSLIASFLLSAQEEMNDSTLFGLFVSTVMISDI